MFTQKVRRVALGAKRACGWQWQRQGKQVKRPEPSRLVKGKPDGKLSMVGGLADFHAFYRAEGLQERLAKEFDHLETGKSVVYPMHAQLQLLLDLAALGVERVFGPEMLAHDALFEYLAGGAVPSVDVLYDDLRRFDPDALETLELLVAEQAMSVVREANLSQLTIDIDPTVEPVFGEKQF